MTTFEFDSLAMDGFQTETTEEFMERVSKYLATFQKVPDDIFLAVFLRDLDMGDSNRCICGWVVREAIARIRNVDASEVDFDGNSDNKAHQIFGGCMIEWERIFSDVAFIRKLPGIETAIAMRLDEIVGA